MAKTKEEKESSVLASQFYMSNTGASSFAASSLLPTGISDMATIMDEMNDLSQTVIDGDNRKIQGALITQSKVLNILFSRLIERAQNQSTIEWFKTHMDFALRAQNQCRKTLLALDAIQNPPQKQIVGQQNIALNQQVNNGVLIDKINPDNELLSEVHNEALDIGRTIDTIAINQNPAAMEMVNGGKDKRRKRKK